MLTNKSSGHPEQALIRSLCACSKAKSIVLNCIDLHVYLVVNYVIKKDLQVKKLLNHTTTQITYSELFLIDGSFLPFGVSTLTWSPVC